MSNAFFDQPGGDGWRAICDPRFNRISAAIVDLNKNGAATSKSILGEIIDLAGWFSPDELSSLLSGLGPVAKDVLFSEVARLSMSSRDVGWTVMAPIFAEYVKNRVEAFNRVVLPEETEFLMRLAKLAAHVAQPERDQLLRSLPHEALMEEELLALFSSGVQTEILVTEVNRLGLPEGTEVLMRLAKLAEHITQPERDRLLSPLPHEARIEGEIMTLFSPVVQTEILVTEVNRLGLPEGTEVLMRLAKLAEHITQPERDRLLSPLPHEAKMREEISALLLIEEQCQIAGELVFQASQLGLPEAREVLMRLARLAVHITQPERDRLLSPLPHEAKMREEIFALLLIEGKCQIVGELVFQASQLGLPEATGVLTRLAKLAVHITQPERDRLLSPLPHEARMVKNLLTLFSPPVQTETLVNEVNRLGLPEGTEVLMRLAKLAVHVAQPERDGLLRPLPHKAMMDERVLTLFSPRVQTEILVTEVNRLGLPEGTEVLMRLAKLAAHIAQPERDEALRDLITRAKVLPAIFTLFECDAQAEISMNEFCEGRFSLSLVMNIGAQIRSIYRAAKFKRTISKPEGPIENLHPLFRACLVLLWAKDRSERVKEKTFLKAHRYIEGWVMDEAWNDSKPLDLTALVPQCTVGDARVLHCEGRLNVEILNGNSESQNGPYCGRLRWSSQRSYCSEARVLANLELPWKSWSLLELLATTGINPCVEGLRHSLEYVPKLGGWVNRLNEIRDHLKCSECGAIMRPNYAYARFAARFNATVVSCPSGAGHDEGVYLNQCWGCESHIIDSRYDSIKYEGFYLCLECGSGPKNAKKFSQGDSCPKCGHGPMAKQSEKGLERICKECGHKIILPPRHKITPRVDYEGQDDFDQSDEIK
jgi:DNA-directed RNA polymerase subunit RPC12/RpoP